MPSRRPPQGLSRGPAGAQLASWARRFGGTLPPPAHVIGLALSTGWHDRSAIARSTRAAVLRVLSRAVASCSSLQVIRRGLDEDNLLLTLAADWWRLSDVSGVRGIGHLWVLLFVWSVHCLVRCLIRHLLLPHLRCRADRRADRLLKFHLVLNSNKTHTPEQSLDQHCPLARAAGGG